MYSFEGEFRRKPQQNLGGASASRQDRNTLLLQTQQQRQKRQQCRKRLNSAIKIQAFTRSYLTRKHLKQHLREQFDGLFSPENIDNKNLMSELLVKILYFYDPSQDSSRLIAISQVLLKQWKKVYESKDFYLQVRRLLFLHLLLLRSSTEIPLAVPLRMLEVFTSTKYAENSLNKNVAYDIITKTFLYLIRKGYFEVLNKLLCDRTPPLYGPSERPPTPLCGALFDLIRIPISMFSLPNQPNGQNYVMMEFINTFLCHDFNEPVEMYILPALAKEIQTTNYAPFYTLIKCLHDNKFNDKNNSWLLYSVLSLEPPGLVVELKRQESRLTKNPFLLNYIQVVSKLTENIRNKQITCASMECLYRETEGDESGSEEETNPTSGRERTMLTRSVVILNDSQGCIMQSCTNLNESDLGDEFLESISLICYDLLLSHKMALQKYKLLYTLAFQPIFLRSLWRWLTSLKYESSFGGSVTPLISALSRGMGTDNAVVGVKRLQAPLPVFCALFSLLIGTLHDTEFGKVTDDDDAMVASTSAATTSNPGGRVHAFEFSELGGLCRTLRHVCLGLIELAYPETRQPYVTQYRDPLKYIERKQTPQWSFLFKVCTQLLRALHVRDSRLHFCDGEDWTVEGLVMEIPAAVALINRSRLLHDLDDPEPVSEKKPPMTIRELRTVVILKEIPFIVPFDTRIAIFRGLLSREKTDFYRRTSNFHESASIFLCVRRTHLYEDAFDKLRPENEPNLKMKMKVQLINQVGVEEAGVDGGGLFREFLSELLKSAFDPNRGLFRLTKDNKLYPNPGVHLLYEDFQKHYYFVGRMLGKALYEALLVELPLAEFFLSKLCSTRDPDVHALASLDPALYRGLLMLKSHGRDEVADIGLDFTIVSDELGEQKIEELKTGGSNIPVTADNRIEYIHLVADCKLNRQIKAQCEAFKQGVTDVVNPEWLRMFSPRELQLVISGDETPIDIEDLKRNTKYGAGYSEHHPAVKCFWNVVEKFTDAQKRQLLRFVTSCSRPPLLGFKELNPPFCINPTGASDRLPSASTCINLLKLPEVTCEESMSEKLLYAIQSGAGFELS